MVVVGDGGYTRVMQVTVGAEVDGKPDVDVGYVK